MENLNEAPKGFKREFQIFKKGVTAKPTWVLSKEDARLDTQKKRAFYQGLGYTITNIQK